MGLLIAMIVLPMLFAVVSAYIVLRVVLLVARLLFAPALLVLRRR